MEKELLTKELILKDIKHAWNFYSPKGRDRVDNVIISIYCLITVLVIMITRSPRAFLLLLVPFTYEIVRAAIDSRKCRRVSAEDITVDTAKLVSVHETLVDVGDAGVSRYQERLMLYFSSGEWEVPNQVYTWSKELHMSREEIDHTSLEGDTFYVVRLKETGEITVAYNQKFFSYRGD